MQVQRPSPACVLLIAHHNRRIRWGKDMVDQWVVDEVCHVSTVLGSDRDVGAAQVASFAQMGLQAGQSVHVQRDTLIGCHAKVVHQRIAGHIQNFVAWHVCDRDVRAAQVANLLVTTGQAA